jgi:predicted PurR-regulated permease PerM
MNGNTFGLSPAATFWAIFLAVMLAVFILFHGILLPFVAGFVLAYLFHPIVHGLGRVGVPRGAAAFLMVAASMAAFAAFLALILPPLASELAQLISELPERYQHVRVYIIEHYGHFLQQVTDQQQKAGSPAPADIGQHVAPWLVSKLDSVLQSGLAFFNSLALLFLTPVITFFLLRDWEKMIASVRDFLPWKQAPAIVEVAQEIDSTISAYLRGTLIVLIILSAFYMTSLGLIGLNYGLLIGLVAGLISFVPYLGSTGGLLISGGVALYQFYPDYTTVGLVCGVFVLGQLVEGNVLTPNIVGSKVGLHPVWLLFALVGSGYLLGFLGLLISVPLAATIGVLVRYALRRYYESPLHNEGGGKQEAGGAPMLRG